MFRLSFASVVIWLVALPVAAQAGWNEPWKGVSDRYGGVNQSPGADARDPVVAVAAGVPYVAWREFDGTNWEVRVARLEGRRWKQPWAGVSDTYGGIAQDPSEKRTSGFRGDVDAVSLAAIGDIPYVAWVEDYQLRVARLEGRTWVQPWTGVSDASGGVDTPERWPRWSPSLAGVGGVAHVAWVHRVPGAAGGDGEVRVARLEGRRWKQPWQPFGSVNRVRLAAVGSVPYAVGYFWSEPSEQDVWVARAADDGWEAPWDDPQTGYYASFPSLGNVDGVPYLAWHNGWGSRVRRLTDSRWETVGKFFKLRAPSVAGIGTRAHIAGLRDDGNNWEVRVTRLEGRRWKQPWTGVSKTYGGINRSSKRDAGSPSLAAVRRVPYVAWREFDGRNWEVRVARWGR